ncbi:MAG: hypothetical protein J0M04_19850 [Verrucomicrobia bacterium]|nr:hypothetical protein [Verrucomicrobiota bacterium]
MTNEIQPAPPKKENTTDMAKLIGISSWATLHQIDTDAALVLMASVLAGVAGPASVLNLPLGGSPPPPVHLLIAEGRLSRALESLLAPVRACNIRSDADAALAAGAPSGPQRNLESTTTTNAKLVRKMNAKLAESLGKHLPSNPLSDPRQAESPPSASCRPSILLEGNTAADLAELLHGCHQHTALMSMKLAPLLESRHRAELLASLADFMDGRNVPNSRGRKDAANACSYPARIHAIFTFDAGSRSRLRTTAPGIVARAMLLESQPKKPDINETEVLAAHAPAARFLSNYERLVCELIAARRGGHTQFTGITTPGVSGFYSLLSHRNQGKWDECHLDLGAMFRKLPDTLLWSLLTWCDFAGVRSADTELASAKLAHLSTCHVADYHLRKPPTAAVAVGGKDMLYIATRIVQKISLKQPVSERDLIRSFDCQQTSIYRPVLSKLIDAEVILPTPERKYIIGSRPLLEIAPSLENG